MELMQRKIRYSERSFDFYHLCYYLSKNARKDADQKLILDFKRYEEPAVRHFIIEAIDNLQCLDLDNDLMIVRALNSNEMHVGDMGSYALDRLGLSLSDVYDCTYKPTIIYKRRKISSIKTLNLLERKAALAGLYGFDAAEFEDYSKVLIIDDVVTTGSTVCAIIDPILKAYSKVQVIVFALAWTPTLKQQEYIRQLENRVMVLNEPEVKYGLDKDKKGLDVDFENGETDISIFP